MRAPDLMEEQVKEICPECNEIEFVGKGGKKTVFSCLINGTRFAIKLATKVKWYGGAIPPSPAETIRCFERTDAPGSASTV